MMSYVPFQLWILLADQRLPKTTLTALCLTSKTLNEIFRPALYREIVLPELAGAGAQQWNHQQLRAISQLPVETHLRHTRRLDLSRIGLGIWGCLSRCLDDMTNLESCSITTIPWDAVCYNLNKIRDICIGLPKNMTLYPGVELPQIIPDFRNLHSLDLRGLRDDLEVLSTSIAEILFNDGVPTIKALGLDLNDLQRTDTTHNLFLDIFAKFDDLRRAIGKPDLRLNLRDLILGRGMYHRFPAMNVKYDLEQWRLSNLVDVTKLRALRLVNNPYYKSEYWEPYEYIHLELFDGITDLQRLSVEFMNQEVVTFIHHLIAMKDSSNRTTLREFQAAFDGTVQSRIPDSPSFCEVLSQIMQFEWRQLLLSGEESCMERIYEASWDEPSYQWEELGISCINWDQHRDALLQLSKLRILMFSYATVTISGERSIVTTCKEVAFNLAKRIFTDFQEHAKKQKRDSSLRYVGIDVWFFTCIWLPSSELNDGRTGAEIVQLDKEEARTFDFVRMNERLIIGKHRLGRML
ncbi:hypothetical protein EAF00_008715 [Botryotinia globosa]|nr:hypothetical protein EAF00_008715 [Botryotinia globosa]